MASSDSQTDKPQHGRPKRAELLDVNINTLTGVQIINTERASLRLFIHFHNTHQNICQQLVLVNVWFLWVFSIWASYQSTGWASYWPLNGYTLEQENTKTQQSRFLLRELEQTTTTTTTHRERICARDLSSRPFLPPSLPPSLPVHRSAFTNAFCTQSSLYCPYLHPSVPNCQHKPRPLTMNLIKCTHFMDIA